MIARRTNVFALPPSVVRLPAVDGLTVTGPRVRDYILIGGVIRPPDAPQPRITMADIISIVAQHFHISENDLRSDRRWQMLVHPRHLAMYLAKDLTTLSLSQIGRLLGGRDHSTVISGIARANHRLAQEPEWRDHENEIRANIVDLLEERRAELKALAA